MVRVMKHVLSACKKEGKGSAPAGADRFEKSAVGCRGHFGRACRAVLDGGGKSGLPRSWRSWPVMPNEHAALQEIIELRSVGLSFESRLPLRLQRHEGVRRLEASRQLAWAGPCRWSSVTTSWPGWWIPDAARCNPVDLEDIKAVLGAGWTRMASRRHMRRMSPFPWIGRPMSSRRFAEGSCNWSKPRRGARRCSSIGIPARVQVDWAGRKLSLYGAGEVTPVSLFVATLPYSDKTCARELEMGMQSWLEHHKAMFAYFGGAPLFVAPDNLATGVVFDENRDARSIRVTGLADHYGPWSCPRGSYATDKAAVETMRIMANSIVGVLEQMRFTSLGQLNLAIADCWRSTTTGPSWHSGAQQGTRSSRRRRECLQPLPEVSSRPSPGGRSGLLDGRGGVRGGFYGVPRAMPTARSPCASPRRHRGLHRRQAAVHRRHPRREDGAETFEGLPGVHPTGSSRWRLVRGHRRTRILEQWDYDANGGQGPHDCVCRSVRPIHWICPDCGFKWVEAPARRTGRSFDDCLACADVALVPGKNDLAAVRPDIAEEWHPTRNPLPASAVFPDFKQQVWWLGRCGHEWRAPIAKRVNSRDGALCPYCSGRKALKGFNDVATLCPELAALWHPVKNRNLTPDAVSIASHREVYLWDGVMTRIWRQNPRKWLEEHGRAELLAPFDSLVKARALGAADGRAGYALGTASPASSGRAF
ncbi:MAG: zinc-ribbon domain-containing protein [Eggerthellaceae bacterium]